MHNKNAWLSVLIGGFCVPATALADRSRNIDSPSPITVISGEEFAAAGNVDIAELLNSAPSILPQFTNTPGLSPPVGIRGIGTSSLYLVNGVRRSTQYFEGAVPGLIPSNIIERIEIVNGGAAATYGQDAIAGVINIVTRDDFEGVDPVESGVLGITQELIDDYRFTVESKTQCDATRGNAMPLWINWPKTRFGMQTFNGTGDFMTWGDVDKGYKPGSLHVPEWSLGLDYGDIDPRTFVPTAEFNTFSSLSERILGDTTVPQQDREDYVSFLGLFGGFMGNNAFTDRNFNIGLFDPDEIFENFRKWAAERTDEDRETFNRIRNRLIGVQPADEPVGPGDSTGDDATTAEPDADSSGNADSGETSADAPGQTDGEDWLTFSPSDFSGCNDPKLAELEEQMADKRLGAIGRWAYHADYMRAFPFAYRTPEEKRRDEQNIADALKERKHYDSELSRLREFCANGATSAETQLADSGEVTDTEQPADGAEAPATQDSDLSKNWSFEFHYTYDNEENGGVPAAGLGVIVQPQVYGSFFGLPFGRDAFKNFELDAGAGSRRAWTDDRGIARIEDAVTGDDADRMSQWRVGLGYRYSDTQEGFNLDLTEDAGNDAVPALPGRVDRQFDNPDWKIFLDLDWGGTRLGPTIGFRNKWVPQDRVFQQFSGQGASDAQKEESWNATPDFFRNNYSGSLSIGRNFYRTYTFPQYGDYDLGLLDKVPGQSFWGNDTCGDSALPPEGAGYLTAEESPVKSVDDQWAFERVGLTGSEPMVDDFAQPAIVGVIDTGIDWNHLDLAWENLWRNEEEIPDNGIDDDGNGYIDDVIGWDFTAQHNRPWDYDGHGTFVAGVIAATQGNDAGIDGINGNARIMVLKALNNFGRTRGSFVAEAIVYAVDNGAQIINLSVAGPEFPMIVQDAVDYALAEGVLVVMAAGNRAEDIGQAAPLRGVLTVAATGADDRRAAFSNVGSPVNLAAPGVDIVSLRARATDFLHSSADTPYIQGDAFLGEDNRYYRSTGTSFATPIVTGIASLVLANNPDLSPAQLTRVLEQSARDVETPGRDNFTGYGIVDAKAALEADPAFFIHASIPTLVPAMVAGQQFLQVIGTADADQFASATLEIGEGEEPESWTTLADSLTAPTRSGQLGRIPVEQLASAPAWTIRLTVNHQNERTREARFFLAIDGQAEEAQPEPGAESEEL